MPLLVELSEAAFPHGRRHVRALSELSTAWRIRGDAPLPPLSSLEELWSLHERALDALAAPTCDPRTWLAERWPQPPLVGDAHVEPLDSLERQEREGLRMRNCVGSLGYLSRPPLGEGYGYHVEIEGHSATCWIRPRENGTWRLSELEGPGNASVAQPVQRAAQLWLGRHRLWARYRAGKRRLPRSAPVPPPTLTEGVAAPSWLHRAILDDCDFAL